MDNLQIGTFLKNGYNRYYRIDSLTADSVTLTEYTAAGSTDSRRIFSTRTFSQLYRLKNWIPVRFFYSRIDRRWKEKTEEMLGISAVGGTRYLIKPAKFA